MTKSDPGAESRGARVASMLGARIGATVGTSRWFEVPQEVMNEFGALTLDPDPMHIDVEWSRANSPFGRTVAFGFWTLSMLSAISRDIGFFARVLEDMKPAHGINYGFDRVRLVAPVPIGSRIRGHCKLLDVALLPSQALRLSTRFSVEVEDAAKPALVADWLTLCLPEGFRPEAAAAV